ncbi:MAG: nucleotidyl transferase AbiEii/AbiGii toxin family protein [Simkaniaceae bacterium]|nr:nucleotidyl transferase AbiEii/AbiGii toxin family protein [Simkaniaceae bacterium]
MTSLKNVAASVKDRLLNRSRNSDLSLLELMKYYAMERFLYRLSISQYNDQFVLKGALLFTVWEIADSRTTLDIDASAKAENSLENITMIAEELCKIAPEIDDGIVFLSETLRVQVMQLKREYTGFRLNFTAKIGTAHVPMQIDIGFGDVITPGPVFSKYPTMLEFPAPELSMYPPQTTIAEKFHAMIELDGNNSRVKDFYDIWLLSHNQTFTNESLRQAIKNTFAERKKEFTADALCTAMRSCAEDPRTVQRWERFKKKVVPKQNQDLKFTAVVSELESWVLSLYEVAVK